MLTVKKHIKTSNYHQTHSMASLQVMIEEIFSCHTLRYLPAALWSMGSLEVAETHACAPFCREPSLAP